MMTANSEPSTLRIRGLVAAERALTRDDLLALPDQIEDVGTVLPKRAGTAGVRLASVLAAAAPSPEAGWITFACDDVWFAASVPLDAVADRAIVVHSAGAGPLPREKGGPFRLLIPDAAKCHTAEIDTCANVKHLAEITLSPDRGTDTRPDSPSSHARLHESN